MKWQRDPGASNESVRTSISTEWSFCIVSLPNFKPPSSLPAFNTTQGGWVATQRRSSRGRRIDDQQVFQSRKGQQPRRRCLTTLSGGDALFVSGNRPGEANTPRLLRREGKVPHGPGGRRHTSARQGTHRCGLCLRKGSPRQELHFESGELISQLKWMHAWWFGV